MPESDVRLDRVSKRFGDTTAVDDVSLTIERGEFFTMLGPVRLRQDDDAADDRRLRGADRRARSISATPTSPTLPPFKRDVNTVFQNYALFPHLNVVREHRVRPAAPKVAAATSPAPGRRDARARRAARATSAASPRSSPAASSSGSRSPARSSTDPQVLLLDEPLGALDQKLRKQMQLELKRIQREVGITFVFVTHDQDEAMTMSDRIAVMRDGPDRAARARPRSSTSGRTATSSPTSSA